jgi:Phospholipase_D-nuclease N-terminal
MERIGINTTLLMAQLCNFSVLLVWPLLSVAALVYLSKRKLPETPKVLWAILIVLIPFLGAFAV